MKTSEGFHCKTCNKFHKYPGYVYAHTRVALVHSCDNCGAKHKIFNLRATQTCRGSVWEFGKAKQS